MRTHARRATVAVVLLGAGGAIVPVEAARPADQSPDAYRDLRTPDSRDLADDQPPGARTHPVVRRVARAKDTRISWDSAAIGALGGTGLLLSAAGGTLVFTRRRGASVPSPK